MFDRSIVPPGFPTGERLTQAMSGIGMRFATEDVDVETNIEDVLLAASWTGVIEGDLRVLSVLTTWLDTHAEVVNVDRLTRVVSALPLERLRAYWVSVAQWLSKDSRWRRMTKLWTGTRVDLLEDGAFHLSRHGEDKRFASSPLRVPANVLRDRAADVDTPTEVARRHPAYRARVMMGAKYRSDMWALVERNASLSAAEIARRTYGSYATAVDVRRRQRVLADGSRA